jgi:hypothetical protein
LNSHYLVIFKNLRDKAQIGHLARQVCPRENKFFMDAYEQATSRAHGYLFLDFTQKAIDILRFGTDIFYRHPLVYIA